MHLLPKWHGQLLFHELAMFPADSEYVTSIYWISFRYSLLSYVTLIEVQYLWLA